MSIITSRARAENVTMEVQPPTTASDLSGKTVEVSKGNSIFKVKVDCPKCGRTGHLHMLGAVERFLNPFWYNNWDGADLLNLHKKMQCHNCMGWYLAIIPRYLVPRG